MPTNFTQTRYFLCCNDMDLGDMGNGSFEVECRWSETKEKQSFEIKQIPLINFVKIKMNIKQIM